MNKKNQITDILFVNSCFIKVCLIILTGILYACSGTISNYTEINREPKITPDYSGITIPVNIAPMNFAINEEGERYMVKLHSANGNSISVSSTNGNIRISSGKWKNLLAQCKGNNLLIETFIKKKGEWIKFNPIINQVTNDSIDSYLVYRLIDPGFEFWGKMGIYQRCLENFNETPVMINDISDGNCLNCHSFCLNNSHTMLFHVRERFPGTILYRNGKLTKVNTKTSQTISPGVYPAWHPDGRHIAFSVNQITQIFQALPDKKVEVIDTLSDLILYDAETNIISNSPSIASKGRLETFPTWSPDGRSLYFCSAKALPLTKYKQIRYDLLRIAFDPVTSQFGSVDTIVSSSRTGLSVSLPRISPDGKYLMFCMSGYGNFTIWHADSDLYLMDLENGEIKKPNINSNLSESYHSWSSNGRWIVFSSRRNNGLFTQPYFTYLDKTGKTHKPFLLPQKDPGFYNTFLKSFNVPELVTSAVEINPRDISEIIKSEPIKVTFEGKK